MPLARRMLRSCVAVAVATAPPFEARVVASREGLEIYSRLALTDAQRQSD